MKRLLALASLLALCVSLPAGAWAAGQCGKHLAGYPLTFRTQVPNSTAYLDSSVFREGSGQNADTSEAIGLGMLEMPPTATATTTATDTILAAILAVYPTASTAFTVSADSFYVAQQVSNDGSTWITITQTTLARDCMQGTDKCAAILEQSSANTAIYPVRLATKQTSATGYGVLYPSVTSGGATAPSAVQWLGYRLMRFIIQGDGSGEFAASLQYWTTDCP